MRPFCLRWTLCGVPLSLLILAFAGRVRAELDLANGHTPYAPLDIKETANVTPSLSRADRAELIQEFRGLLAMGQKNYIFDRWAGRPMADCYSPESSQERWRHKCEIMMGHGNGYYFFYDAAEGAVLQQVEVLLPTSDASLIEDLKPTLRRLFGAREMTLARRPGYSAIGPIRRWNTGGQIGDLFLDASRSPAGTIRFIWSRGELARSREARAR